MNRKTLLSAAFATALMGFGAVAQAQSISVRIAPPAPRVEVVPVARAGQVWVRGHYVYRGNQYAWVPGHFVRARAGYVFQEPRWVQRNGAWVMTGGTWARGSRDRDRDGIANRYDRDRDGDGIRNGRDVRPNQPNVRAMGNARDRDGDGVRNSRDIAPNNGYVR